VRPGEVVIGRLEIRIASQARNSTMPSVHTSRSITDDSNKRELLAIRSHGLARHPPRSQSIKADCHPDLLLARALVLSAGRKKSFTGWCACLVAPRYSVIVDLSINEVRRLCFQWLNQLQMTARAVRLNEPSVNSCMSMPAKTSRNPIPARKMERRYCGGGFRGPRRHRIKV
jgi:hypothetical protein